MNFVKHRFVAITEPAFVFPLFSQTGEKPFLRVTYNLWFANFCPLRRVYKQHPHLPEYPARNGDRRASGKMGCVAITQIYWFIPTGKSERSRWYTGRLRQA